MLVLRSAPFGASVGVAAAVALLVVGSDTRGLDGQDPAESRGVPSENAIRRVVKRLDVRIDDGVPRPRRWCMNKNEAAAPHFHDLR